MSDDARARFDAFLEKPEHKTGPDLVEDEVIDDPTEPDWHKAGKDAPPGWVKRGDDFEEDAT